MPTGYVGRRIQTQARAQQPERPLDRSVALWWEAPHMESSSLLLDASKASGGNGKRSRVQGLARRDSWPALRSAMNVRPVRSLGSGRGPSWGSHAEPGIWFISARAYRTAQIAPATRPHEDSSSSNRCRTSSRSVNKMVSNPSWRAGGRFSGKSSMNTASSGATSSRSRAMR